MLYIVTLKYLVILLCAWMDGERVEGNNRAPTMRSLSNIFVVRRPYDFRGFLQFPAKSSTPHRLKKRFSFLSVSWWSFQTAMNEMAQRGKKATDAAVRAAQQTSTAMQYLQMQQQQLSVSNVHKTRPISASCCHRPRGVLFYCKVVAH